MRRLEILGKRFGALVVIGEAESLRTPGGQIKRRVWCECDCGKNVAVMVTHLCTGHTVSCGCLGSRNMIGNHNTIHGEARVGSHSKEYRCWRSMRSRCEDPTQDSYKYYGGRGITVCKRWSSFQSFLEDMGRAPGLRYTLDRVDPDGNYEPTNCRWATKQEQALNRRKDRWGMNKLCVSRGNTKLGNCVNISFPPVVTCCKDAPCIKECYALKHAYALYKNVKAAWDGNLKLWLEEPGEFQKQFWDYLGRTRCKMCRINVGGDIPDEAFLAMVAATATRFPKIKFLAFTKKYDLIDGYKSKFPENLRIVLSAWPGYKLPKRLQKKFPVAWMLDKDNLDKRIPEGTTVCPGACETCGLCWEMKEGENVCFEKH